jgi:hypothetical protein
MILGDAGSRVPGRAVVLAVATLLSVRTDAQTQTSSPSPPDAGAVAALEPTPEPTPPAPKRLRLDIDRLVEERLEEDRRAGVPHFETEVEVVGKSPQVMLYRFLRGIENDCRPGGAPPGGGAPTHIEMREARWNPSPSADLGAALMLIAHALKGTTRGQDKYFLYRVNVKGDVSYLLREGRLPDAMLYARPGTTYELIKAYADTKSGGKALRRMERGFATPEASSAPPPAAWQISTCRPR